MRRLNCFMKMIQRLDIISLVGYIYLLLAVGTFTAYEYIPKSYFLVAIILLSLYAYFLIRNLNYIKLADFLLISKCILPFAIVYLSLGFSASDYPLYFKRIEGAFVATLAVALLVVMTIRMVGLEGFLKYLLITALLILVITLSYKMMFGFWDRGVRFFINGPIVFSWFMGFGILVSLYLRKIDGIRQNTAYLLIFVFSCAMAWTESKGPLVVLLFVLLKVLCDEYQVQNFLKKIVRINKISPALGKFINSSADNVSGNINQKKISASVIAIVMVSFILVSAFTPSGIIGRFLNIVVASSEVNYGSIGIRIEMWKMAWKIFLENMYIGVGPTNWGLHSGMLDLLYPHNILLEVASELGLVGLLALFFVLINVWIKTTYLGRITILYFLSAGMLSGDISYLRLIMAIPIALVVLHNRRDIYHF